MNTPSVIPVAPLSVATASGPLGRSDSGPFPTVDRMVDDTWPELPAAPGIMPIKPTARRQGRTPRAALLPAGEVRRAVAAPGSVRDEIAFQNDINKLLATLESVRVPFSCPAAPLSRSLG